MRCFTKFVSFALILSTLSACEGGFLGSNSKKAKLEGERKDAFEFSSKLIIDAKAQKQRVNLPKPNLNKDWEISNVISPLEQNLELESDIRQIKSYNISKSHKLGYSGSPVISNGTLFFLDSKGKLVAFNIESGKLLWSNDHFYKLEKGATGIMGDIFLTGALSIKDDVLYATAGLNSVAAIDIKTGQTIWSKALTSPTRSVPVPYKDKLIVQTLGDNVYALNLKTGNIDWLNLGLGSNVVLLHSTSPAVGLNTIFIQRGRGDLVGVDYNTGEQKWTMPLTSSLTSLDIDQQLHNVAFNPVFNDQRLYLYNMDGILFGINALNGEAYWKLSADIDKPFWISGDWIFAVNSRNEMLCINKNSGGVKWIMSLPQEKKKKGFWSAPIVADNKVLSVSSAGKLIWVDPNEGEIVKTMNLKGSISVLPIVAEDSLFLVSNRGKITRYQ